MDSLAVQCLRCGTSRIERRNVFNHLETPECPACGYLGWAPAAEPAGTGRHEPRKRPTTAVPRLTSVA